MSATYLHFDDMAWPNPQDPAEVEHALRYGTPTPEQLRIAASFVAAFKQLVEDSPAVRDRKVDGIRSGSRRRGSARGSGATVTAMLGPDRYPAILADQATTTAPDDVHRHAVYDTGSFGILTHCGQLGTSPIVPGRIDCPVCEDAVARAAR